MKRVFLYLMTNAGVLLVMAIVMKIFGITHNPRQYGQLLAYAAVMGFTGSIISLLMSKIIAKNSVNAQVIEQPSNQTEMWLLNVVETQAKQWGFKTPEVAIYDSPQPNAFATGATKNSSLVAVSSGLLTSMTRDEVEAVLAHEMAHIGNGDMVTLTLIQGVVNTFVIFLSRVLAHIFASMSNQNNRDGNYNPTVYFLVSSALQMVFGLLASIIVMWFSRQREYRADAGAARLVGAPKMIAALERLKGQSIELPKEISAMGIANEEKDSWLATHPSLNNRIARLQHEWQ